MLHWLIFLWAVLVLVSSVGIVVLIFTRRPGQAGPNAAGHKTQEADTHARLARRLDLALAQSQTDAEFERILRRLLAEDPAFETETQWASLLGLMNNYRRAADPLPGTRLMAQRLLDDFPRLYGAK